MKGFDTLHRSARVMLAALTICAMIGGGSAVAAAQMDGSDRWDRDPEATITASTAEVRRIVVQEALRSPTVSPSLALALAGTLSGFDALAEDPDGGIGVMRIRAERARKEFGVARDELWNPRLNAQLGITLLERALERRRGRVDHALSDYHRDTIDVDGRSSVVDRSFAREVLAARRRLERDATVARLVAEIDRANPSLAADGGSRIDGSGPDSGPDSGSDPGSGLRFGPGSQDWRVTLDETSRLLSLERPGSEGGSAEALLARIGDTRRRFRSILSRDGAS